MMKSHLAIALVSLMSLPLAEGTALAQECDPSAFSVAQAGQLAYDPSEGRQQRIVVEITSPAGRETDCDLVPVAIETRYGGSFQLVRGGRSLPASFNRSGEVSVVASNRVTLTTSALRALENNGVIGAHLLTIARGEFVEPGLYELELDLVLSDDTRLPFTLSVSVTPAILLLSSDGNRDIALGEISNGATVSTQFMFRTNASLTITAHSTNDGTLLHQAGPDFGSIPYEAFISGQLIESGDMVGVRLDGAGGGAVQSGELRVVILPQEQTNYSGIYRDTLSLTLTAN